MQALVLCGNGTGGFRARTYIGSGWNTYPRLIGAGDLTGDRRGDLLAVDKAGVKWRYNGNGRATTRSSGSAT